ncbi:kunitz-like toxin PcKuz3 [Bacillus rossius redtenbacheri]|uniref:kunitz-like toxin PcKuz3 n=1 Tax=Bacillus rossius redtenbacheri TaxID=93214 RepID=UPI002FDE1AC7
MFGSKLCLMLLYCVAMVVYEVYGSRSPCCKLPVEPGPCKHYITRYFFNTDTGRCQMFQFGGCQSNCNNFKFMFECQAECEGY